RKRDQRTEHGFISGLALTQPFGERREDVRGLAERLERLFQRQRRKIFEEQRQKVGQFGRVRDKPGRFVLRLEVDHGLAAVAALAMNVLEQMQRKRARAVEQEHVALLQVVEVAGGKLRRQLRKLRPDAPRQIFVVGQDKTDVSRRVAQLLGRIDEQRRERLERAVHHTTSMGVLARFGVPNRLVSVVPPEQPLPNE